MQQFRCLLSTSDVYYQLLSQHVSGIIMPINKDRVLLHMVLCTGSAGCGWLQLWGVALLGAGTQCPHPTTQWA